MDIILNEAESLDTPNELLLFDRQLFSSFIYDEQYTRQWYRRIKQLLDKDWNISIIINAASQTGDLNVFIKTCQSFNLHPKYHEYYFISNVNINLLPTTYVIKDRMAAIGYCDAKSVYSSIYKDKFSIQHVHSYIKNLVSECEETFTPQSVKERVLLYDKISSYESSDEPSYGISTNPSFICMSEELINDILKANDIYGDMKSSFLRMYHTAKNIASTKTNTYFRHILYPMQLKERLVYEKALYPALSALFGKEIYITNEQFREHLKNAAEFINEQSYYSIALTSSTDIFPSSNYCFKCKNKLYVFCADEILRFNTATSIVQSTFTMLDDFWCKTIEPHNKDKEIVVKTLLEIADMK